MMSSEQIARLSDEAAARAERKGAAPRVPPLVLRQGGIEEWVKKMPNIGSYRPVGWELVQRDALVTPKGMRQDRLRWLAAAEPYLMVDASGFGSESEPALSFRELVALVEANPRFGYAIVEEGQFQVVVGVFERTADAPKYKPVPWQTVEGLAYAFVAGKPGKCHNADTDGQRYRLHASDIVTKTDGGDYVFDWCGWYTPTTANHINAVLRALGEPQHSRSSDEKAGVTTFTVRRGH
jgi:hypothetical protein